MKLFINPMNQRIIWEDTRMGYEGVVNLDRLNTDLSFKKTEMSLEGDLEQLLNKVVSSTKFKKNQWVEVKTDKGFKMEEVWKTAMKEYKERVL